MGDLGDILRGTREKKGLTVAEVAFETRIRGKIILALEAGDYQQLPPQPFIQGLLKNYARYLHLEPDLIIDAYSVETGSQAAPLSDSEQSGPELRQRPPTQGDAPEASEHSAMFVLPPSLAKREESPRGDAYGRSIDVPPILSSPGLKDKSDGTVSGSMLAREIRPEFPSNQAVGTRETTVLYGQGSQPVFQVAPDVLLEPAAVPDPIVWMHRLNATKLPEIVAAFAIAVAILAIVAFGYTHTFVSSTSVAPIVARVGTATITPQHAAATLPTPVPTFEATTAGKIESLPTTTEGSTLSQTPPVPLNAGNFEMDVEVSAGDSPVWAWVIVDNVEVFKGDVQNDTKNWMARQRLYIQVKDLPNGSLTFAGKAILPRIFEERKVLERAWEVNLAGTPLPIEPRPFLPTSTPTPGQTTSAILAITGTLTPTFLPTSTPIENLSPTATITATTTPTVQSSAAADSCPATPGGKC